MTQSAMAESRAWPTVRLDGTWKILYGSPTGRWVLMEGPNSTTPPVQCLLREHGTLTLIGPVVAAIGDVHRALAAALAENDPRTPPVAQALGNILGVTPGQVSRYLAHINTPQLSTAGYKRLVSAWHGHFSYTCPECRLVSYELRNLCAGYCRQCVNWTAPWARPGGSG
jgi:hypothetical protein